MFSKGSFVVIIVAMILEYILTFVARIFYYMHTRKIGKTFDLALPRQQEVLYGRLSMGENIKLTMRKDEKTTQEEFIEATLTNVNLAKTAMRASGAHYNQWENLVVYLPACVLALSVLSWSLHNYWWIALLVWIHLALRVCFIIIYIIANNQKTALIRTLIFVVSTSITVLIYIVVLVSVL